MTSPSNSGVRGGAAVFFGKKLDTELVHLPCLHHVHDVILGHVFAAVFSPSSDPVIPLFNRFLAKGSFIAHKQPEDGFTDPDTEAEFTQISDMMDEALEFAYVCV